LTLSPDFSFFKTAPVINAKTGKSYTLEKITTAVGDEQTLVDLVQICNEPVIYEFMFRERCKGAPYVITQARTFIDWALKGWEEKAYFVFVVRDAEGRLAAAIDIRSNDLAAAELGYWASAAHSGIMTPTVEAMSGIASQAGYAALFAYVRPDNERSRQVLLKSGFIQEAGIVMRHDLHHDSPRHYFKKTL
jgi:RimJ/RimL family protein N-acetyltransferase